MSASQTRPPEGTADLVPVPPERGLPSASYHAIREHLISEFRSSSPDGRDHRARVPRLIRARRGLIIAGLLGTTAVAAITASVVATNSAPQPIRARAACVAPFRNGDVPFPGARRLALGQAQSVARFSLPVPHTSIAGAATLSQVWVNQGHTLVAFIYGHRKVTIELSPWTVTQRPSRWFRHELQIMSKKSAIIGQIHGGPALIVQPKTDYCHANPALVEFYWRGTDINITSTTQDTAALIRIADSMH